MEIADIQRVFRERIGMRIEPHMGEYVQSRLSSQQPIPVIGGDARTGVPMRRMVDPQEVEGAK